MRSSIIGNGPEIPRGGYFDCDTGNVSITEPYINQKTANGEFEYKKFCDEYNLYNANWNNPGDFPFPPTNPIKVFLKKIVRKIGRCIFRPIVNYQNSFNQHVVCFLNQVKYYIENDLIIQEEKQQMGKKVLSMLEENRKVQEVYYKEIENRISLISRQLMEVKWKQIDDLCNINEKEDDILTCKICGYRAIRKSFDKKVSKCKFNGGKLERYVCPECGVIFGPTKFLNMSQTQIDEDYQMHYYGFEEGDLTESEIEAFYMLNPDRDGVYLNYGCGCWSKTISQLRADGYDVWGYEPYASETNNPYIITNKEEIKRRKFNGIFTNNLLEHLINPVEDICFMKTLLMNPDAKMSHSTPCYAYVYEYTRFHTHFFLPKTLDVLCERVGLEILDSRNELESRDFICYVYGMKESYVNYENMMWLSESEKEAERKNRQILLHKNGMMYGPYITQGKGTYKLGIEVEFSGCVEKVMLFVTANKGKKRLANYELINGYNIIIYVLGQKEEDVEFYLKNEYGEDILIKEIKMFSTKS